MAKDEIKQRQPGMMTLIALAISVAYFYSSAVVFGVTGEVFFWELATLIDVMLLGHFLAYALNRLAYGVIKGNQEAAHLPKAFRVPASTHCHVVLQDPLDDPGLTQPDVAGDYQVKKLIGDSIKVSFPLRIQVFCHFLLPVRK